jgi:microcystin-dependent protein
MSEPFLGQITMLPYFFPPVGWARCDGQVIPMSENPALFAIIGNIYGGDGRTTMGLPDLKARAPMHPGRGPGLRDYLLGQLGGSPTIIMQSAHLPIHTHSARAAQALADETMPTPTQFFAVEREPDALYITANAAELDAMADTALEEAGGTQAHYNLQPFIGIPFCIALEGIFPPRN